MHQNVLTIVDFSMYAQNQMPNALIVQQPTQNSKIQKNKGEKTTMKFDNILMDTVQKILESNHVPMLLGEPGIGKSSWVEALGKQMHTEVFVLACNQLSDKADMTGARLAPVGKTTITNPDGSTHEETEYAQCFFPHIVVRNAIAYAKEHPTETPILFLDELNRTTPDVTSEALSLPTLRSLGNVALPDNLRIITAGNDKGNITALDEASRTRFVLLHVTPDVDTFLTVNPELNPFVQKVIAGHPETIFGRGLPASLAGAQTQNDDDDDDVHTIEDIYMDEGEDMSQLTTPRTISSISDWLNQCTNDELKVYLTTLTINEDGNNTSMLQEIIEAHTGKTAFSALLLAEINGGINVISNQSNKMSVAKPRVYDTLVNQPTRDDLNEYVEQMSDKDKSGCLIYALYNKDTSTDVIQALSLGTTQLIPDDSKTFATLMAQNMIPEINKTAFFNSGSQLANLWSQLFG